MCVCVCTVRRHWVPDLLFAATSHIYANAEWQSTCHINSFFSLLKRFLPVRNWILASVHLQHQGNNNRPDDDWRPIPKELSQRKLGLKASSPAELCAERAEQLICEITADLTLEASSCISRSCDPSCRDAAQTTVIDSDASAIMRQLQNICPELRIKS